uniref:WSC domain-containing protein n=1 Tax=Angiostrongylus cantonensis TaxID=6313 RepID=A0A158PA98_ANGCA
MLCHDVRRFSLCFHHPGCSEQTSASIASVQYHMVFGKKLPLHIFLAYKGYGKQICEQSCSRDALLICRNAMSSEEQLQEQVGIFLILSFVDISGSLSCISLLFQLIRLRGDYCGDLARCTCGESRWEIPIVRCSFDCEQTWGKDALDTDSAQKAPVIAVFFLIHMFM